jgi:hypothetical protein
LGGGGKIYLGKNIDLRIQGRLLMPLVFSCGGPWYGKGGCSVAVES